jgi:hypothetical protein
MKQSEAVLIPALLAARVPRPVVEEANIEGVRMLVIIGNEVDTVIRYNRGVALTLTVVAGASKSGSVPLIRRLWCSALCSKLL